MKSKWCLKFLIPAPSSALPTLYKLSLLALCYSQAATATNGYYTDDFDELLMTQHTTVALCGELHYKRQSRDCTEIHDLKRCLELNYRDPLFTYQENASYSCVNTSYSAGVDIIKNHLLRSEKNGGCLAANFRKYFNKVIASKDFYQLANKFEESLGQPLKLNYGIDTKDGLFNLQMDTSLIEGPNNQMINISVKSFNEDGHCNLISAKKIIDKISAQLNRLRLKTSRGEYDYYADEHNINRHISDAPRNSKVRNNLRSTTQIGPDLTTSIKQ